MEEKKEAGKHTTHHHEHHDMKIDNNPDKVVSEIGVKMKKNPWMLVGVVLGIIVIILLVVMYIKLVGVGDSYIKDKGLKFVNDELLQGQTTATFVSLKSDSGVYVLTVNLNGKDAPLYFTKDGNWIQQGGPLIPLSNISSSTDSSSNNQNAPENIPKSDKPKVDLYVMAFCPYGVKAENNIMPILELLKDKIDFNIRYIVSVDGSTINDVSSLHGLNEAKEDARQLIIKKYYSTKFLSYIKNFDANCYQYSQDEAKLDTCWKAEAKKLGMDTNKIETAAYGSEGITLLKAEAALAGKNSVTGSPTLIINGVQSSSIYSGTTATQTAICSTFNTAPSECKTVLKDSSAAVSGSC